MPGLRKPRSTSCMSFPGASPKGGARAWGALRMSEKKKWMERIASHGETMIHSERTNQLAVIAKDGRYPCDFCPQKNECNQTKCYAFYLWFKDEWKRLQALLLGEAAVK